ncbi:amidohydrolase [Sesbania bispinosa]|nr:amidohydrolase [Sesbania bispinosa]
MVVAAAHGGSNSGGGVATSRGGARRRWPVWPRLRGSAAEAAVAGRTASGGSRLDGGGDELMMVVPWGMWFVSPLICTETKGWRMVVATYRGGAFSVF